MNVIFTSNPKCLILGEPQYFVWDTVTESIKWLDIRKIGGNMAPWGYAYGPTFVRQHVIFAWNKISRVCHKQSNCTVARNIYMECKFGVRFLLLPRDALLVAHSADFIPCNVVLRAFEEQHSLGFIHCHKFKRTLPTATWTKHTFRNNLNETDLYKPHSNQFYHAL